MYKYDWNLFKAKFLGEHGEQASWRCATLYFYSTCLIVAKTDLTFDLRDCHWVASVKGTWILLAVRQGHGLVSTASNLIVF